MVRQSACDDALTTSGSMIGFGRRACHQQRRSGSTSSSADSTLPRVDVCYDSTLGGSDDATARATMC